MREVVLEKYEIGKEVRSKNVLVKITTFTKN
jgi:hypothetical protein